MAENIVELLTDVADAIREKKGSNEPINAQNFADEIKNLPSGEDGTLQSILDGSIEEFSDDKITQIRSYCFSYCNLLKRVKAHNATEVGAYGFQGCGSLIFVELPLLTTIQNYLFYSCTSIETIYLPNAETINNYAFCACSKLKSIKLKQTSRIAGGCFKDCASLINLTLETNKVCSLGYSNSFDNTPIKSGTGYIYVPDNLVESYKSATNWSAFASQIKGLSELPQE
jgi:hypothetical protein